MTDRAQRLARKNILDITPYVAGKPIDEVKRELGLDQVVKLASNENCLGPSGKAMVAIESILDQCHLYPDGDSYSLKMALSAHWDMDPDCFLVGNGSDEILKLVAETFLHPDEEILFGWPSFSEYIFIAKLMGATMKMVPLKEYTFDLETMAGAAGPKTKLAIVCNPNNPTGTITGDGDVRRFLDRVPRDTIVIIDEAYAEYVEDPEYTSGVDLVKEGYNIIALRTFSKIYGLAGLRVGYAVANPEIIQVINKSREPFNVNSLAQEAARAALGDFDHLERSRKAMSEGKTRLYQAFNEMGLPYVPTQANFILVDTGRDSNDIFDRLLRKGVIVRPTAGFGLPTHIRVTLGTAQENEAFLQALREALGETTKGGTR